MRSALVLALLLGACATPAGRSVGECDASWRDVESVIVRPASGGSETETVPIDCMRRVDQKRVRIGFSMPPGPACYTLSGVDVVEAADAVSIALWVTAIADPAAGACPEEATRTATEIDLEAPVADRSLLDGSAAD
jgi:hypothetical protein